MHCLSNIHYYLFDISKQYLTTSKNKNEKSSRNTNFRGFRGFALHYESAESTESWENSVFFINIYKAGWFFNWVETSSHENQQWVESGQLFTWKIAQVTWYKRI